jgi:putative membrane protein
MWVRRYLSRGPIRPNEGSMARDHLANERTFLSWVRTALAFIGLGVLTAELVETEGPTAEALGLALIVLGAAGAITSTSRYLRVTRQLDEGRYQSSTIGPIVVGIFTLLVAIAGLGFVLT